MIKKLTYRLLLLCTVLLGVRTQAQVYPVNASIQLGLPNSSYFYDYSSVGSSQLTVNLLFQDYNEPSWDVRLNIKLESSDIVIQTDLSKLPSEAITLTPGSMRSLSGADLFDYFDLSRVSVTGTSKSELSVNGKLPEGLYTFTVEVLDYNSGKVLSNRAVANAWLQLNDEPITITPTCESNIQPMDIQIIPFQWQLTSSPSPEALNSIVYRLDMYELTDMSADPFTALNNGKALQVFESEELTQTSLVYDMSRPMLEQGKIYIYRVQAYDIDGEDRFKNDGYSEVCWFRYGYPSGGEIELIAPEFDDKFNEDDPAIFSWGSPDNLIASQEYSYELTLVKLEGDLPAEEQMENNIPWHSMETDVTTSTSGWQLELDKALEPQFSYAWQVKAYSEGQEIAASEVRTFYGPTLIDEFRAGQHTVYVNTITNGDLSALAGTGKVKISNSTDDSLMTIVSFEELEIIEAAGRYVLQTGEIVHTFTDTFSVDLAPRYIERNGNARFYPEKIKLNKEAMEIYGYGKWPLPHNVITSEKPYVISDGGWVNYDDYAPFGTLPIGEDNKYDLLEPLGFTMNMISTSEFQFYQDKFELRMDADIYMPESVEGFEDGRISFQIVRAEQLFYIEESDIEISDLISLVDNTQLGLKCNSIILDLDEDTSPLKLQSTSEWKGVYINQFEIDYPAKIDASNQLEFEEYFTTAYELTTQNDFKAWVGPQGLTSYFHDDFEFGNAGTFNSFPAQFNAFSVDIENNAVTDSRFLGSIKIPVIDKYNDFEFTVPMSNGGFETGYLNESLEHHGFVFSPYGGENRVDLTIQKATFADNERIDLVLDIEIPYIEATMTGVEDFRVYGDYYIGFGKANGAKDLEEQVKGTYDGFTMYIDKIGAGLQGSDYVFSYSATMPLGEEVAGEEGAPRLNIASSASIGDDFAGEIDEGSAPAMELPKPEIEGQDPKVISVDSMYIGIESEIVDIEGYLILTKDDPTWGTSMKGGINGDIKIPVQVGFGSNMILGTKDDLKYWYFDAYFIDETGRGIPVFNMFNIVAFEGKVYRHMRQDMEAEDTGTPNFEIDESVEFGTALYTQLIDQSGGSTFQSDVGIELVVESDNFVVAMEGDISLINANTRSKASMSSLSKEAAKAVAAEAATQVLEELDGKLEINLPLSSGKEMGVAASLTEGEFSFSDGGAGFVLGGSIDDVPAGSLKIYDAETVVEVKGSVDGAGSFSFASGSTSLGLAYDPNGAASVDLGFDNNTISATYNNSQKAGTFNLSIEDVYVDVALDKTQGKGHIELAYESDKRIYCAADKAGKAEFELQYEDVMLSIAGDQSTQSGSIGVQVGDNSFNAAMNKSAGTAELGFKVDNVEFDVSADKSGIGELGLAIGGDEVFVKVDKPAGVGQLGVSISGNSLFAGLNAEGVASFDLDVDGVTLGISGNKDATAGGFRFDDGNTNIEVEVDKTAGTGHAYILVGSDSVKALVSPELNQLQIGIGGNSFAVESDGSTSGKLSLATSDFSLGLGANNAEKSGYLDLEIGSDILYIAGNQSEKTADFDLELSDLKINAGVSPELNTLGFEIDDIAFAGEANSEKGSISFAKGDDIVGVGVDKSAGSGYLNLAIAGTKLDVAANTVEKSGSFLLEVDETMINTEVSSELKKLEVTSGETSVSISTDGENKGDVALSVDGKSFAMGGNKSEQSGYMAFSDDNNSFEIGANGSEQSGYLGLGLGDDTLYASIATDEQSILWHIQGQSVNLVTDLNSGIGDLSFSQDNVELGLGANYTEKSGAFSFNNGDVKLDLAAALEAQTAQIDFEGGGVEFNANYAQNAQSVAMAFDNYNVALNKTGARAGDILVANGDNEIGLAMDYESKQASLSIKTGNVSVEGDINATDNTGSIDVKVDATQVAAAVESDKKQLDVSAGPTTTKLVLEKTGNASLDFAISDYTTSFKKETSVSEVSFGKGSALVTLSTSQVASFSYSGISFEIDFSKDIPNPTKNGEALTFSVDDLGNQTIDFSALTNGEFPLTLSVSSSERSLSYANAFKLVSVKDGDDALSISIDGQNVELVRTSSNKVTMVYNENSIAIDPAGSLEMSMGDTKKIALSKEAFDMQIDDYKAKISSSELLLSDANNSLDLTDESLIVSSGQKSLGLYADKRLELVVSEGQTLNISEEELKVEFEGVNVSLTSDKKLNYADGNRTVALSASAFEFEQGTQSFSINSNKELALVSGEHSLKISPEEAELITDGRTLKLSAEKKVSYADNTNSFEVSSEGMSFDIEGKQVELTKDYTLSVKDEGTEVLNVSKTEVALNIAERSVSFGTEGLNYKDNDRSFDFSDEGVALNESGNILSLNRELEFNITTADGKSLDVSPDGAALSYDNYEIEFDKNEGLAYADGSRSLAFGGDGIEINEGDYRLAFTSDSRLELSNGGDQQLQIDETGLQVVYGDKEFALGKEVGLKYADASRSFALGEAGLEVEYDEYVVKALEVDGKPAIELSNGDLAFVYADGQASFEQDANLLTIGGDHYFTLDYDGKMIKAASGELSFEEDDLLLALGGDEDFVKFAQGERLMKVTKDKELVLQEGKNSFMVSASQELEMSDGSNTLKVGGDDIISFTESSNTYRLFSPSSGVYGVGFSQGDYGVETTVGSSEPAAFKMLTPYGDMELSTDQSSNITMTYGGNTLKTGKQGLTWESADGDSPAVAETEYLDGAAEVDYSGPQYIGDKITDESNGLAKGSISMYYNSAEKHFIANAAVASVAPPCITGAMAIEATESTWSIDIGTEEQRVEVYPSCSGFGGGGWMNLTPSTLGLGVFVGWKAGGTVDIGVADITAEVGAELGIKAKMEIDPDFAILEAGIWVLVYGELSVDPVIGSKFTIAEASLSGTLTVYFEESTRVKGELDGYINVCGIKGSFDMGFNTSF